MPACAADDEDDLTDGSEFRYVQIQTTRLVWATTALASLGKEVLIFPDTNSSGEPRRIPSSSNGEDE